MAQESLNVLLDPTGKMLLAEAYKGVIENVQRGAVSMALKNTDLSGDADAGTLIAKRFMNASPKDYGTARTAGNGDYVKGKDVPILINVDKEIVEEVENKDVKLIGVDGFIAKRAENHARRMIADLDTAFFDCARQKGTAFTPDTASDTPAKEIDEAVTTLSMLSNDYIDGIDTDLIDIVCSPAYYSQVRQYVDTVNSQTNVQDKDIRMFHGVRIHESNRLGTNVDFEVMLNGAIAQPLISSEYTPEKINLSDAYAIELFYSYGTKAVVPEAILVKTHA